MIKPDLVGLPALLDRNLLGSGVALFGRCRQSRIVDLSAHGEIGEFLPAIGHPFLDRHHGFAIGVKSGGKAIAGCGMLRLFTRFSSRKIVKFISPAAASRQIITRSGT
jgi:hypothetical protein